MERILSEQTATETPIAEADDIQGEVVRAVSFEKFKDVESLLKAYNSLEAEFTKRSQRMRQLEGECEKLKTLVETKQSSSAGQSVSHEENAVEEFLNNYPDAERYLDKLSAVAGGSGDITLERAYIGLLAEELKKQAENAASGNYDYGQVDSATKDRIVRDFLSGISGAKPRVLLSEGEVALTPPIRPKSLQEAKLLAEKYFK